MNTYLPAAKRLLTALMLTGLMTPALADTAKPTITSANGEFVYKLLLAEIVGQRGEPGLACQLFWDLAQKTRDPRLAERAARVAVYANQPSVALQAANLWAELAPNSKEAQQAASQLLVASGNLTAAKPFIKKLLADESTRPSGFMYINSLLVNQSNKDEVLQAVKEFAAPYPKLPEAHFAVAQAALLANQLDDAATSISKAEKLKPEWEATAQMRGQFLLKDKPDEALKFYQQFLSKYPKSNEVRLSYAKLLVSQKRLPEAKSEFVKLVEASKGAPEMSAMVGLLSLDANDYPMADKYLKAALDKGFKDPEQLYVYLGRSAERQKNDDAAMEWFEKVGEGDHYLESRLATAGILARTQGADAAVNMLDNVDNLTPQQQVLVIQAEAGIYTQAKRSQDAFNLLEKATQNLGDIPELVYDYAIAAERIGKLSLMESELYRLIKIKPDYAAAYNALGYSFADRNVKLTEAKNLIETALKLQPGDHYMMDSLGWVHYRMGNLSEAAKILRQAYAVQADPEIAAHLGEVLWKQGLQEEAKKIWATALEANPENEVLIATSKRFPS